ncbi:MAG: hypothetical protein ABIB93_04895 [Chloroflexota bacterium]
MNLTRRDFLRLGLGLSAGTLVSDKIALPKIRAAGNGIVLKDMVQEKTTICPYDGSGCGFLVASSDGKMVNIEGDPDHPVNNGGGCAKGVSIRQIAADNPRRLTSVLYRAPGASDWETKSWDWAITEIARRIKKTRDESFIEQDGNGMVVNRTEALANLGGSALDNEECYLLVKMARAFGIVYLEHHARI